MTAARRHANRAQPINRRRFLWATAAFAAATPTQELHADASRAVHLRPSGANLHRVRIEMEVQGNVDLPKNPLVSSQRATQLPIETKAVFDYEERFRRPQGAKPQTSAKWVDRFYHEARSESTLNRTSKQHAHCCRKRIRNR